MIQETVENMIEIDGIIGSDEDSYIEEIQNWSLKHYDVLPDYSVCNYLPSEMNIGTPDWAKPNTMWSLIKQFKRGVFDSNTQYASLLILEDVPYCFIGYGNSKNQAKEEASRLAYEYLDEHDLLWTIQDEIENPCKRMSVNQLETLARRGYFSLPTYNFYEDHDEDGNPVTKGFITGKTLGESGDDLDNMFLISSAITKAFHGDGATHARYIRLGESQVPTSGVFHLSSEEQKTIIDALITQHEKYLGLIANTESLLRRMTGGITQYIDQMGRLPLQINDYDQITLTVRDGNLDAFKSLLTQVLEYSDDLLTQTAGRYGGLAAR